MNLGIFLGAPYPLCQIIENPWRKIKKKNLFERNAVSKELVTYGILCTY